jgi:F-type H+-transporting ATPase subunit alpha
MRQVAGKIKLELAQYQEVASFSQFSSDLDASSQKLLQRGERLTELLKQPQNAPFSVEEQVVLLFAGTRGFLDQRPVAQVQRFQDELLVTLRETHPELLKTIRTEKALYPEIEEQLSQFLEHFTKVFV